MRHDRCKFAADKAKGNKKKLLRCVKELALYRRVAPVWTKKERAEAGTDGGGESIKGQTEPL